MGADARDYFYFPVVAMSNRTPIITSYRSVQELVYLREWFYNFDNVTCNRWKAVQRVKALKTRGKLPHAVEVTALITSAMLSDPEDHTTEIPKHHDGNILRLSYSMALIRFVNGLLDPYQQSTHAIPLHQLANSLKLPGLFVELRHMGTHETLPELEILRFAANKAMNWLFDNYWSKIGVDEEEQLSIDVDLSEKDKHLIDLETKRVNDIISKMTTQLRIYKNLRKADMDYVFKRGQLHENTSKYFKAVDNLKSIYTNEITKERFLDVILFNNFLVYNDEDKAKKQMRLSPLLVKLYKPLIDELGPQFKLDLVNKIVRNVTIYENQDQVEEADLLNTIVDSNLGFKIQHEFELVQLQGWVRTLLPDIMTFVSKKTVLVLNGQSYQQLQDLSNDLVSLVSEGYRDLLEFCRVVYQTLQKNRIQGSLMEKLQGMIEEQEKEQEKVTLANFAPPPSLDDILAPSVENVLEQSLEIATSETDNGKRSLVDDDMERKKVKKQRHFFFEIVDKLWKAVPFGELP